MQLQPGTIISGTTNLKHVVPALHLALQRADIQQAADFQARPDWEPVRAWFTGAPGASEPDPEVLGEIVGALCDALEGLAPEGHYVGTHPGDGADWGVWPDTDADAEPPESEGGVSCEPDPPKHSYEEIVSDYRLWVQYVDPSGVDQPEDFERMSKQARLDAMVACFGPETIGVVLKEPAGLVLSASQAADVRGALESLLDQRSSYDGDRGTDDELIERALAAVRVGLPGDGRRAN